MGRTYIVEETVGQYLSNISLQGKAFVSGLLIGQCSSQKDYVILATRTPPKEEKNENPRHPRAKLDNLDEEWATEHANQVSRMLPGGLLVLGVFIITTLELANDFQNALRRIIFAMVKSMNRKRLWSFTEEEVSERVLVHLCSSTKKISCRTYDVHDPKSSPRPADWKYQNGLSASWLSLECTVHINIHIPLSPTSVTYTLEKNAKNGLTQWAKQIENGVYLINGQVKDGDCDLLDGQKKSRGNTQVTPPPFGVQVLTHLLLNSDHRSTAIVQTCSGSVNLQGAVKCRAYLHSSRPKVKDAVQAVKRDILNTVADRCEILFEDLLLNEIPEKKGSEKEFHILPHRVFVPIPGSTVMFCDYKFGDESDEEIRHHFIEMLDQMIQIEDLEVAEEINTAYVSSSLNNEVCLDKTDDDHPEQPMKTTILLKIQQNIGVITAFAVAVLAAGISFHYFSD
ncbi:protein odr-4 homolog isoform X2 [Perognathus longimembris pacificus]|uniref:protein odr-4 homolog isoform X2 n=1 Tax=Perognathus longimembris pacificus TaxID=214514 RepID=UPI002019CF57|nr:protein odr-4 homolog isoform X2 [Perognathus longimembris pacificus]